MLYHIECRFKSLTNPQAWTHVAHEGQSFSLEEVLEFQRDLGPDDWDYGMEYRARVVDDCRTIGSDHIMPLHPPLGLTTNNVECERGPAPLSFVSQLMNRLFVAQGV